MRFGSPLELKKVRVLYVSSQGLETKQESLVTSEKI